MQRGVITPLMEVVEMDIYGNILNLNYYLVEQMEGSTRSFQSQLTNKITKNH